MTLNSDGFALQIYYFYAHNPEIYVLFLSVWGENYVGTEGRGEHRLPGHEMMHYILVDGELAFLIQLDI